MTYRMILDASNYSRCRKDNDFHEYRIFFIILVTKLFSFFQADAFYREKGKGMFLLRPHDSDEESFVYNSDTDIEGSDNNPE